MTTSTAAKTLEELVIAPYQSVIQELGGNSSEGTYQDAISDVLELMEAGIAKAGADLNTMRASLLLPLLQNATTTGRGAIDPQVLIDAFKRLLHRRVHCWLQDVGRVGVPGNYTVNTRLTQPGGYLHVTMKRNLRHAITSYGQVTRWSVDDSSFINETGDYCLAFSASMFGLSGRYVFNGNILND